MASQTEIQCLWDVVPQNYYLKCNDRLYCLDIAALNRTSDFFKDAFKTVSTDAGKGSPGRTENNPLVFDVVDRYAFEALALIAHGSAWLICKPTTIAELRCLLEASIFLQSRNLYNHSIDFLQPFYRNRRYADVISVCFQYGIRRDFEEAYKDFLEMSWYDVQTEQLSHLPPAALLFTLRVRQDMDIHRRRVALESPKFKEHDPTCSDPDGCGDDWHTLWWNVVGTGLCNGHEQLTYSRAVERLKMASTGRMSRKCFEQLVAVAESAQGWGHIYDLTSTAAVKVMEFIPDPPF